MTEQNQDQWPPLDFKRREALDAEAIAMILWSDSVYSASPCHWIWTPSDFKDQPRYTPRKQSARRMLVAQKRQHEYKDVLRRRRTYSKQLKWFWHWFRNKADNKIFLYSYDRSRPFQEIGIRGILPEYRAIIVRISYVVDHWLIISDAPYHTYTTGATINKAIMNFRHLMQEFVV